MKWIIFAVVLVPIVVVLIGYALPKEHVASRKVVLHASPEAVFALIAGPSVWRGVRSSSSAKAPGTEYNAETKAARLRKPRRSKAAGFMSRSIGQFDAVAR